MKRDPSSNPFLDYGILLVLMKFQVVANVHSHGLNLAQIQTLVLLLILRGISDGDTEVHSIGSSHSSFGSGLYKHDAGFNASATTATPLIEGGRLLEPGFPWDFGRYTCRSFLLLLVVLCMEQFSIVLLAMSRHPGALLVIHRSADAQLFLKDTSTLHS